MGGGVALHTLWGTISSTSFEGESVGSRHGEESIRLLYSPCLLPMSHRLP